MRIMKNKNKGFSLVELIVVIAVLAVIAAVLAPSLMQYTENSRAQKDVSAMDEVVNAVQLAVADEKCFDEVIQYSCTNNYLTYSDSSGNYGQQINDGEFWAPDGSGKAVTITFNPEFGSNNQVVYDLSKALVNDMTYGNGSTTSGRVMEGALIEDNQCYLSRLTNLYNAIRQAVGHDVITTSQTYRNSSFTVFIKFTQKDGVTVADVNGSFNGTNLYEGAEASKGSNTSTYDPETGDAITSIKTPGKTESNYTSSDLMGSVTLSGSLTEYGSSANVDTSKGVYYVGVTSTKVGNYTGATAVYKNGEFPESVTKGDVFVLGDYEYRYNQYNYGYDGTWYDDDALNGWGTRVLNTSKTSYKQVASSINNTPVRGLSYTYYNCKSLLAAPTIPAGITSLGAAFTDCTALRNMPAIPEGVTNMTKTFQGCTSLKSATTIPSTVTKMNNCFNGCTQLTGDIVIKASPSSYSNCFKGTVQSITLSGPSIALEELAATDGYTDKSNKDNVRLSNIIPEGGIYYVGVTSKITGDYSGATAVYKAGQPFPELKPGDIYVYEDYEYRYRSKVISVATYEWSTSSSYAFYDGWGVRVLQNNKTSYGKILSNINGAQIKYTSVTFAGCNQIKTAPQIPSSVVDAWSMFYRCTSLECAPILPNKLQSATQIFAYCKLKTYAGSSDADYDFSNYIIPSYVTDIDGAFRGTSLKYAPVIPATIQKFNQTFRGCTKLTGTITINTSQATFDGCLNGTSLPITLTGTSTKLNEIAATATNNNVTVQQ